MIILSVFENTSGEDDVFVLILKNHIRIYIPKQITSN